MTRFPHEEDFHQGFFEIMLNHFANLLCDIDKYTEEQADLLHEVRDFEDLWSVCKEIDPKPIGLWKKLSREVKKCLADKD